MRDMGKDDKSIHRPLQRCLGAVAAALHEHVYRYRQRQEGTAHGAQQPAAAHVRVGDQGTFAVVAPSSSLLGPNGRAGARPGQEKWTMSVLPTRVPLHGRGGRGGCEGIRTHSRDPHGSRPAVDLPLTLVASVPLPGCVEPGAGLVGGTGMGRMEKETDLRKGAQRGGARVRGPTTMGKVSDEAIRRHGTTTTGT